MSTATGHGDRKVAKPAPRDTQRDLYDPHFPVRPRTEEIPDRTRSDTFDPHFPPLKRN